MKRIMKYSFRIDYAGKSSVKYFIVSGNHDIVYGNKNREIKSFALFRLSGKFYYDTGTRETAI